MTFLQKSYDEYTKVEKTVLMIMSYEGANNEEELEMVLVINDYNNVNLVIPTVTTVTTALKMTTKTFLMKMLKTKSKQPSKPLSTQ